MKLADLKKFNLPDAPGVYFFKRGAKILYVGKATSLKDRVKSYFARDITMTRGPKITKMLEDSTKVEFTQTDSVLEALILEANEIKKHQPIYNAKEKDDKSYNFITITKEEFPKVVITRGSGDYGPFPHSSELKEGLKIIRKIFPFRDEKCKLTGKPCFNAQLGLCAGPCAGWIMKTEYRKLIKKIKLFFEGKKPQLIKTLEKEMSALAKKHEFEEAEKIKRQLFALDHIQDIALIKQDLGFRIQDVGMRIEAYDIAHLSGKDVVGVMTVVDLSAGRQGMGEVNKSQYRKFKIKADKNDDTKNLKEVLERRFGHPEWPMPQLIVVDGGMGQLNAGKEILKKRGLNIEIVSLVKDERHKAREIKGLTSNTDQPAGEAGSQGLTLAKSILLANSEAHRFAIGYHRKLRSKGFRI